MKLSTLNFQRRQLIFGISLALICALLIFLIKSLPGQIRGWTQQKKQLAMQTWIYESSGTIFTEGRLPETVDVPKNVTQPWLEFLPNFIIDKFKFASSIATLVQYGLDGKLQKTVEKLFQLYLPDYGSFVAMDATTGEILSLVSFSKKNGFHENFALRATFPSASVFKVVTAAAAIERGNYSGQTVIPYNGRRNTLYKKNIIGSSIHAWSRFTTLSEAFATSNNTVFGKIGAYAVGSHELKFYADRFGFNRKIPGDLPIQEGRAKIPEDAWGLAESASGFTRENTMSPLQGALIAAAIVNDGVMMKPYIIQSLSTVTGKAIYLAKPQMAVQAVDPHTAQELRGLMRATVTQGTSRKSFRGFFKRELRLLDVGGKTGSLSGLDPKGKYDWFIGYAESEDKKIALASLTIHEKQWRVKSSYVARKAIEAYFSESSNPVKVKDP